MPRTSRWLVLALPLLAVAVSACSDGEAGASELPPFEPVSTAVETEAGVLVVRFDNGAVGESHAIPLDAETLDELPGEVPMFIAGVTDASGRWMGWLHNGSPGEQLTMYDLKAWEVAWELEGLPEGELRWHGSDLYLWGERCDAPGAAGACKQPWERAIWRLTPDGAEEVVRFDFTSYVASPRISEDGTRAFTIGVETDLCCGMGPQGDPFLAVIDLAAGEVIERIPLPGLLVGEPGHWLGSTEHQQGGRYLPGLVLSHDEETAYVVHAETDQVAEVDLAGREVVATHSLEDEPPVVARLGGWLLDRVSRTAEAKETADYFRDVEITPDGRYLLVSGSAVPERPEDVPLGQWVYARAAGLLVVDLLTMDVVYEDEMTQAFTLSPNGYSVIAWGRNNGPIRDYEGLTVLDLRSMTPTRLFENSLVVEGFASPDGRFGYARIRSHAAQGGELVAFDLTTLETFAEYPLEQRSPNEWDWPHSVQPQR